MTGLKISVENEILHVSFLKPAAGNSFGIDDAVVLAKALKLYRRQFRGLLWTSEHPRLFCAGGDLKHHVQLKSKNQGLEEAKKIAASLRTLAALTVPKAAIINGDCFGGGLELLSCFDYRIASAHVLFGFWQRRIGLSFGWGGYNRWGRQLDIGTIKELAFTARVFGAGEALRLGIIDSIGSTAVAGSWLRQTARWGIPSGEALTALDSASEARTFQRLWWSADHLSAIRKFSK